METLAEHLLRKHTVHFGFQKTSGWWSYRNDSVELNSLRCEPLVLFVVRSIRPSKCFPLTSFYPNAFQTLNIQVLDPQVSSIAGLSIDVQSRLARRLVKRLTKRLVKRLTKRLVKRLKRRLLSRLERRLTKRLDSWTVDFEEQSHDTIVLAK